MAKKKPDKVENSEQLGRLLSAVANDLVHANCYYKLFRDLNDSVSDYKVEMNESRAFWGLTRDALFESAVIRLCRIYERDKDDKARSLGNLLQVISNNKHLFDYDHFCERVKENEHIGVRESFRELDERQLDLDIIFASESNLSVVKLIRWRDSMFVHRSSRMVIRQIKLPSGNFPTYGDYESLLSNGMDVVNRYSSAFQCLTYSRTLIGGDDYLYVLNSVRKRLEVHRNELRAEYEKYGLEFDE